MKRYSLLLETALSGELQKKLDQISGFLCSNCDGCQKESECTKKFSVNAIGMTESDSYDELEKIARIYNSVPEIIFIGMIDHKDDLFYIFKSDNDMEYIRKDIMPKIAKMYEYLTGNGFLLSGIKDLREIMKFAPVISKVMN